MKHLQVEQVGALIEAAGTDRNKLLFRLLYEHGLRISECLSLTRAHVRRGYLQIKGKKKGKRADEKLNPATLALFESVTKTLLPNTLIFPFSRQWASSLFHRACDKAGIALQLRQGVHSLRHSLAHHLLDAGAPLPVVQKSLRHRSIGSTGVYLEADGRDVDVWRSKAITGTVVPSEPPPMSLAQVRAEIARLSKLAAAMQPEADAEKRRVSRIAMPVQAEASDDELLRA
jgi:site-specific recombinase XerD